jgi:hypothetical protein
MSSLFLSSVRFRDYCTRRVTVSGLIHYECNGYVCRDVIDYLAIWGYHRSKWAQPEARRTCLKMEDFK